jgi:hypothetical protein
MTTNNTQLTEEELELKRQKIDDELPNFCLPISKARITNEVKRIRAEAEKKSPSALFLSYFK